MEQFDPGRLSQLTWFLMVKQWLPATLIYRMLW